MEQFLNRIMVLHVDQQNRFFELFYERYREAGRGVRFGVEEIRARNLRRVAEPQTLFVDPASGAGTTLHELEGEVDVERHTFETVLGIHAGEVLLIGVEGPRRGLERSELAEKYERVERDEARAWREAEYAKAPATEMRGFHILSGDIFPIYDKIMGSSGIHNVKVARATVLDGRALVGLNLSASDVPNVKQRLGIGTPLGEASAKEILGLLAGGAVIELDNGWQLTRARIAGDEIVELVLNGVPTNRAELERYGLSEEVISYKRRWFVRFEDAPAVLSTLFGKATADPRHDRRGRRQVKRRSRSITRSSVSIRRLTICAAGRVSVASNLIWTRACSTSFMLAALNDCTRSL